MESTNQKMINKSFIPICYYLLDNTTDYCLLFFNQRPYETFMVYLAVYWYFILGPLHLNNMCIQMVHGIISIHQNKHPI